MWRTTDETRPQLSYSRNRSNKRLSDERNFMNSYWVNLHTVIYLYLLHLYTQTTSKLQTTCDRKSMTNVCGHQLTLSNSNVDDVADGPWEWQWLRRSYRWSYCRQLPKCYRTIHTHTHLYPLIHIFNCYCYYYHYHVSHLFGRMCHVRAYLCLPMPIGFTLNKSSMCGTKETNAQPDKDTEKGREEAREMKVKCRFKSKHSLYMP